MTPRITEAERAVLRDAHAAWLRWVACDDGPDDAVLYAEYDRLSIARADVYHAVSQRRFPVRHRVATALSDLCCTLCAITRHVRGCWLLTRSLLRHVIAYRCTLQDRALREAGVRP